jgi:hypothetical protein
VVRSSRMGEAAVDERAARVGRNEALFRSVNEQIEDVNRTFSVVAQTMDIVCECGARDCLQRLVISMDAYERVRRDPTWFVVLPGHVVPAFEDVVEGGDGYVVVEKKDGDPSRLAEATDPRS